MRETESIMGLKVDNMSKEIDNIRERQDKQDYRLTETEKNLLIIQADNKQSHLEILSRLENIQAEVSSNSESHNQFKDGIMSSAKTIFWMVIGCIVPVVIAFVMGGGLFLD